MNENKKMEDQRLCTEYLEEYKKVRWADSASTEKRIKLVKEKYREIHFNTKRNSQKENDR